jgi:hypothetical protein
VAVNQLDLGGEPAHFIELLKDMPSSGDVKMEWKLQRKRERESARAWVVPVKALGLGTVIRRAFSHKHLASV